MNQSNLLEQEDREKIEIFISCRSLTIQEQQARGVQISLSLFKNKTIWVETFKTEVIKGTANPNFTKSYTMDYIFEQNQPARFQIIDLNGQVLGECETSIGQIVGSNTSTLILPLKNSQGVSLGKIILRAEKVASCNDEISLKIYGKKIKDLKFWTKSSPFLIFYRSNENNQPIKVHETEHVKANLNPSFEKMNLKVQKLCNGDYNMPMIVECWDYHTNGNHQFIGQTSFSINQIQQQGLREFTLKKKKNNENCGTIIIQEIKVTQKPQFLDYIKGGTHLNLICAVDFTGSNGDPKAPDCLHAIKPYGQLNQYQQAIQSVGEILLNYDEDKLIPLFGFGAKPKLPHFTTSQTLHCFPLNGNPEDPNVKELKGLMETYSNILNYIELSGPTLFNPLIQETMKIAKESKENKDGNYYILLILTDGEIHDMDSTIPSIIDSSHLPMSIIIVGIGNANFKNMDILDGDDGLVDQKGRSAKRDLVQFVPFNKFKDSAEDLAANVLEELPTQLVEYYQLVNEQPKIISYQRMESIQLQKQSSQSASSNFGEKLAGAGFLNKFIQQVQVEDQVPDEQKPQQVKFYNAPPAPPPAFFQ